MLTFRMAAGLLLIVLAVALACSTLFRRWTHQTGERYTFGQLLFAAGLAMAGTTVMSAATRDARWPGMAAGLVMMLVGSLASRSTHTS